MTDAERFNRFNITHSNLSHTLNSVFSQPGVSLDLLERATQAQEELVRIQKSAIQKWNAIAEGSRHQQSSSTFDADVVALENLHPLIRDLHTEAIEQTSILREVAKTIDIDKKAFSDSLEYHKGLASFTFYGIFVVVGIGLIALASLFGLIEWLEPKSTQKILDLLRDEKEFNYKVSVELVLLLGGRFSLIVGLAWLAGFLGKLHNNHTRQAIYYQDKIMGLEASKVIISAAKTVSREKIISDMATTYLGLNKNAFEKQEIPKAEKLSIRESIALRILERLSPRLPK